MVAAAAAELLQQLLHPYQRLERGVLAICSLFGGREECYESVRFSGGYINL